MTLEEHNKIIADIVSEEDVTKRQTLLLQLQDDYKIITSENETLKTNNETLKTERDNYAKLNNELWLRNNTQNKDVQNEDSREDNHENKRNFEDLNFD